MPEDAEKTLKPDESQPQKANNETDITFIEGEAMPSLEDEEKIALYTEAIERLDAIIGHELDDTGKMAIISAVLKYPKYIACDPLTKSKIAVSVTRHNKLIAVLDVDSTEFNSFNEVDKSYLELIVKIHLGDRALYYANALPHFASVSRQQKCQKISAVGKWNTTQYMWKLNTSGKNMQVIYTSSSI